MISRKIAIAAFVLWMKKSSIVTLALRSQDVDLALWFKRHEWARFGGDHDQKLVEVPLVTDLPADRLQISLSKCGGQSSSVGLLRRVPSRRSSQPDRAVQAGAEACLPSAACLSVGVVLRPRPFNLIALRHEAFHKLVRRAVSLAR